MSGTQQKENIMKLTKSQFCTAINNYHSMLQEEEELMEALGIDPEWKPNDWIQAYYDFLIEMCELDSNDYYGNDVDWFCFETDFGRRKDMCVMYDVDTDRNWRVETPEILYDFITRDE